ncbi:saccharopine dehydrogenase-like oxidoreductase [Zophobas morio]|uniref:saccharopine dehydrogenase-like oxidoreductase n=1 Tax=Zophobas morio TaxID=2755281 RepID=UPI003083D316
MSDKLDVIIFGASGFSGGYVVHQLYKICKKDNQDVKWGLAGRSTTRLQATLKNLELKTGSSLLHDVPIFEADTTNEASLEEVASKARLIINCTGPYKFHGEPVVKACIRQKCHYVDLNAEPQFMERMQLVYNEEAAKNGVYVVTSCGIDNIPADIGLEFLRKSFKGSLNSVECYVELIPEGSFGKGAVANYGTWQSFLYTMGDYAELRKIRTELFKTPLPKLKPKLPLRRCLHKIPFSNTYAGPYPGGEATVMRRSQRYFYEQDHVRPIQIHTYVGPPKFWQYILLFVAFILGASLIRLIPSVVKILLKHPKLLTLGFFDSKKQPAEDVLAKIKFAATFRGRGWKGKIVDEKFKEAEDSWMVAKVSGTDPYEITGICAAAAAIVLLDDGQSLPKRGGVYTTAAAFANTNLVEVLQRHGLKFDIIGEGRL